MVRQPGVTGVGYTGSALHSLAPVTLYSTFTASPTALNSSKSSVLLVAVRSLLRCAQACNEGQG